MMVHFDERYRETVTLRDRSIVTLRLVRPDDKELMRRGFERLSADSRYRRFFGCKNTLSDAELVYLTEVDGHNHFAIGAVAKDARGDDEGVAVARFIRSKADTRAAEVAVTVVDDWQRKGLATVLLLRLAAAARERGVECFTGLVLPSNVAIHDVLAPLEGALRVRPDPEGMDVEVDLPDIPSDAAADAESHAPIRRLVALIARGLLVIRRAVERLTAGPGNDGTEASSGPSPVTQKTTHDAGTRSAGSSARPEISDESWPSPSTQSLFDLPATGEPRMR
jgi:GNAT superfamily N-acetyltransferase